MFPQDLLTIGDLTREQAGDILNLAVRMKQAPGRYRHLLTGRTMAMLFEKPSLRTRATFDIGFAQLGGHPVYLSPESVQMGRRETPADIARNLERWVNLIVARVFAHHTLDIMAEYADVPVINALSDLSHPCQALADFQTLYERNPDWNSWKLAWIGDGNNVCRSVTCLAAMLGVEVRIATPPGYDLPAEDLERFRTMALPGREIMTTSDPRQAVAGANVVYTDVWTSMGQESEQEIRLRDFQRFQINAELLAGADQDVVVLHCLPAHRGEEITAEVLDRSGSVFDQAENRLHAQKAVMALMLAADQLS